MLLFRVAVHPAHQNKTKSNTIVFDCFIYPSRRLGMASTVRLYGITFMCMASPQGAFSAT